MIDNSLFSFLNPQLADCHCCGLNNGIHNLLYFFQSVNTTGYVVRYQMWHLTTSGHLWFFQPICQQSLIHTVSCASNGYRQTMELSTPHTEVTFSVSVSLLTDMLWEQPRVWQRRRHHANLCFAWIYKRCHSCIREGTRTLHDAL